MTNFEGYTYSRGEALREVITDAKRFKVSSVGTPTADYWSGYLMAFHRIVTLMQQHAESYELPAEATGVSDIEESYFV